MKSIIILLKKYIDKCIKKKENMYKELIKFYKVLYIYCVLVSGVKDIHT